VLPGQIMSRFTQASLKLSDGQRAELAALQQRVDDRLDLVLTADQKERLRKLKDQLGRAGPATRGGTHEGQAFEPDVSQSVGRPFQPDVSRPGGRSKVTGREPRRGSGRIGPEGKGAGLGFRAPPGRNPVFRAYRYGTDYPGVAGKGLRPGRSHAP
jgi:hypothetical protein